LQDTLRALASLDNLAESEKVVAALQLNMPERIRFLNALKRLKAGLAIARERFPFAVFAVLLLCFCLFV
jgi:hypothetical protein